MRPWKNVEAEPWAERQKGEKTRLGKAAKRRRKNIPTP